MSFDLDEIIAIVIVTAAAFWISRGMVRRFIETAAMKSGGCGGCGGCAKSGGSRSNESAVAEKPTSSAVALVGLDPPRRRSGDAGAVDSVPDTCTTPSR
jgi:hypothetical protein